MTKDQFKRAILREVPIGQTFNNPGGGTSMLNNISVKGISYVRGNTTIYVSFDSLYSAYDNFKGRRVSSTDLRAFAPSVFDSAAQPAGHSCNCTFFFQLLNRIGLSGPVQGRGVRGNPYSVVLV